MTNTSATTDSHTSKSPARPFGMRDKIGYLFGDFGNDFSFILQMMFFMMFYTDVMGLSPLLVGGVMAASRLVDAFTDVGMGRLVDVLRPSKAGRFRPWILRMAIPVSLASTMMYMPFVINASEGVRTVYMVVTYLLWGSIFYTSVNIPYGSMAAVISADPKHRSSLSVFRSVGAQLAYLLISAVLPKLVFVKIDGVSTLDSTRMALAAVGCAIAGIACYALCYVNVIERIQVKPDPNQKPPSFAKMIVSLVNNKPLIWLVAGAILFLIGSQIAGGATGYLWKDYFGEGSLQTPAQIVSIAPVFVLSLVATWLGVKFGKKEVVAGLLGFSSLVCIVTYFLGISADNPYVFITLFFFISLGVGMYNVLVWAMITDVLDYQEYITKFRDDGTVYAIYSWSRKLGQSIAALIVGWAITGVGYDAQAAKDKIGQTQEVKDGIYMLFTLVPGLLYLATALVLWFLYPLTRDKVKKHAYELALRHGDTQAAEKIASE